MASAALLALLTACSGTSELFSTAVRPPRRRAAAAAAAIGTGAVRVGLILPLSAGGNAGTVAQSMKNAAEMALAEFNSPNVQLLVKDDGGTSGGAQQAAQQALAEGAEIIIGPLFAHSVGVVGAAARQRGVPVIAFSTDASVAARGVYLLSFLPESDVDRIVDYAIANGKRSFAAMLSEGAYGNVVEAEFKQVVARKGGAHRRARTLSARSRPRCRRRRSSSRRPSRGADAVFIPEGPEVVPSVVQALIAAGLDTKRVQLLGTGLWDDPRIFNDARLHGGWYAAPDSTGFRNFSARYRARYNQDPVRTATLAYDAVALVAALVKTQGRAALLRAGADQPVGLRRHRRAVPLPHRRHQRARARGDAVGPTGGQIVSPPPRAFGASGDLIARCLFGRHQRLRSA